MAGDWIKMRGNLWDDPRVSALVDATDSTEAAVVGALYWLWASADQHTENGVMPGLTLRQIDRKTGVIGFGAALCAIGWISDHPEGIQIVNFEEHNGASAKRRSEDAKRKADVRKVSDKTKTDDGIPADIVGRIAELEKELEIEKEKSKKKTKGGGSASRAASRKCPVDFLITDDMRSWAALECPGVDVSKATAKFSDHTFKTAMTDWPATWRNWLRSDQERAAKSAVLPAWREQQRSETQKAVPRIALGAVNPNTFFTELGASNVTAFKLG